MPGKILNAGDGQIWIMEDPSPTKDYSFLQGGGAGQDTRPAPTATPYYESSPGELETFIERGRTRTIAGRASGNMEVYFKDVQSVLERIKFPFHVQFRWKTSGAPSDPLTWSRIRAFLNCDEGQFQHNPNVARTPDAANPIVSTFDFSAPLAVEYLPITLARVSTTEAMDAVGVAVQRSPNRDPLKGKITKAGDIVYVATKADTGASANLLKSTDGGKTFAATAVDPLSTDIDMGAVFCVGSRVIVLDAEGNTKLAFSDDGGLTWTSVDGGETQQFKAMDGADWSNLFFVATGGFLLKSGDGGASLSTVDAGTLTSEDYADIRVHENGGGIAVAANNAAIKSGDGGGTWAAITGPDAGTDLLTCEAISPFTFYVGTAAGELWVTEDGGETWDELPFSASSTGTVDRVRFSDPQNGCLVHTVSGASKILRTVNGGKTWILPPNSGISATPTNSGIADLTLVDANHIFFAGPAETSLAFIGKGA